MGLGWNPWRALREREHLEFALVRLPDRTGGGVYWPEGDWAAVLLDRRLSRVERADALAHELVHDERGGGCESDGMPATWDAVVGREERTVETEVARRRVPLHMLAELVDALVFMEMPVEAWSIAEQFDVSEPVARRALELLGVEWKCAS